MMNTHVCHLCGRPASDPMFHGIPYPTRTREGILVRPVDLCDVCANFLLRATDDTQAE